MTFVFTALLLTSALLIASAIEDIPIMSTVQWVLQGAPAQPGEQQNQGNTTTQPVLGSGDFGQHTQQGQPQQQNRTVPYYPSRNVVSL